MKFTEPEKLGKHSFEFSLNEANGLMYTCKGGFIDIGHVREAADRTAYLRNLIYENLIRGDKKFSFRMIEPSRLSVNFIGYPLCLSR